MLPLAHEQVAHEDEREGTAETQVAGESGPQQEAAGRTESVHTAVKEAVNEAAPNNEPDNESVRDAAKSDEESMASNAERMTILRMIEQGKISAEDGARLLNALGDRQGAESKARPVSFDTAHQLQVKVSDLGTNRQKVNVTLPIGLVQLVWRWLPASAKAQYEQIQAAIDAGAVGRLVEVVDVESGVRVEITLI